MSNWAICFYIDVPCLFQRVVSYEKESSQVVTVFYRGEFFKVPMDKMREINPPKFAYGDTVSPANHLELTGVITDIVYHGGREEPMHFIEINGKRKSKRYFEDDLVRRL